MSVIDLGNVWSSTPPGPIRARAQHHLRYRAEGFQFTQAYKLGRWDGYTHLVTKTGHFPAGLTSYLLQRLSEDGLAVEINDTRVRPPKAPQLAASLLVARLERHQTEAVDAAEMAGRGIVQHPTGSGKTFIIAGLVHRLAVPVLILCHRKDLLWQLHERISGALSVPALVGVIGDGQDEPNWVTVATFQSVHKRLSELGPVFQQVLDRFSCVIVDEAHHASAKTYGDVLKALGNCYYRFGLSATPFREGDEETMFKVTGWLGPALSQMSSLEAMDVGRIVPADVFLVDPGSPDPDCTDYQTAYRTGVIEHKGRNRIIVDLATRLARRGSVLILVERIEHGERVRKLIEQEKLLVSFIHGGLDTPFRKRNLDWFRSGEIDILISSVILDEGIDLPNIRTLILAGAGKAPHKLIQRIGRGMRAHEGKDRVTVIDFVDKGTTQFRDKKTREWKKKPGPLANQTRLRRKTYEGEPAYSVTEISYEELTEWLS